MPMVANEGDAPRHTPGAEARQRQGWQTVSLCPTAQDYFTCCRLWRSLSAKQFSIDRALFALRAHLNLKADTLIWLWMLAKALERLDMHKDLLPALVRLDKAKSSLIVP
jgi:hypothetical protein